jgi:tripeptide aminopeptidase
MVRIGSESGNEQEFIAYLRDLLTTEFQADCRLDEYGNLIASVCAKACSREEPVIFAVHADTVKPGVGIVPVIVEGVVRPQSDTILGSDDKAGIAELTEAMRQATRRPPMEIIVTREEELGFRGARHVDVAKLKGRMGFVLDGGSEVDAVITGGPSHMYIDADVTGRAAHAGVEPEKGISAIEVAAHAISILRLGRVDEETTLNFGMIQGGEIRNGVPERVTLLGESRSMNHEKCLHQGELVSQAFDIAAKAMGARAVVHTEVCYKAADLAADSEPVRYACEAIRRSSMNPKCKRVRAGTEAAVYNEKGLLLAVLSQGVRNVHSKSEHIYVSDMEKAVEVLLNLFGAVCENWGG